MPPAEPPAQLTLPGFAPEVVQQCIERRVGGPAGTVTTSYSFNRRRQRHGLVDGDRTAIRADGAQHHLPEHEQHVRGRGGTG